MRQAGGRRQEARGKRKEAGGCVRQGKWGNRIKGLVLFFLGNVNIYLYSSY